LPVLSLRSRPFGTWQRALKRTVDLALGSAALVLSLPLWLVIAALIRLTTREPALFSQERIGEHGQPFVMHKLRSMAAPGGTGSSLPVGDEARLDEQAVPHGAGDDEGDRVTPIGRWLRKYSLDELPQLLNVLRGDMSLVGPRPELPRIVARYAPWQRKRLEVKPGMTGLWQILGRKNLPLTENIHYDFYYIRNQSLLFDLAILLRTIPAVLSGRGAY
jgi:lipopolysaccharide/colanic/teichoic acid biosynthesis glycosyltransferase